MKYLILLLLAGCAAAPIPPPDIISPVIISNPMLPEPLSLRTITPLVMTKAYSEYAFSQNPETVYISLTLTEYEKLLTNVVQVEGYILELHNIIRAYRDAVNSYSQKP